MGTLLNISRFCTDDGPGIRTTVFLKGCPLRCAWCHNPESQHPRPQLLFAAEKCVNCGKCVAACAQNCHAVDATHTFMRERCLACAACAACADACPTGALELYGSEMSVEAVLARVLRDKVYYDTSGGGVTVSGGEPLSQAEFCARLFEKCRESGIHTALETSGFGDENGLRAVLAHCDLVLFDIKETDARRHEEYTGVSMARVQSNLALIDRLGVPILLRAPIIPGYNDRESHFSALRSLADSLCGCRGVQLMPYHKIGEYKYKMLGRPYECEAVEAPDPQTVANWNALVGNRSH